ncbi:glutathione peroxidase [Paenibacillus rigui]|uniref:Glutathione peroxidase n=1 Tax=Paenibacillus rigui TaxID=554312 RepID=A0A229UIY5_9BACL|nr:glutathione peroxidase [Paenibacillus rigui]OXM83245.1 glutathione peroxidase [Paenibacillus rigui]
MTIYDFQARSIDGELVDLSIYRGKTLLVVNTASKCAYSRQFAGLQKLYEDYHEQGFEILAFPCNQFNGKEPGSNAEVRNDCESHFGISFPLFQKTDVRGPDAHPLFQYVTRQAPFQGFDTSTPEGDKMYRFLQEKYPDIYEGDGVKWNFSKFLINRQGLVAARYECTTDPSDLAPEVRALLERR